LLCLWLLKVIRIKLWSLISRSLLLLYLLLHIITIKSRGFEITLFSYTIRIKRLLNLLRIILLILRRLLRLIVIWI
jgi:hypothetical protein